MFATPAASLTLRSAYFNLTNPRSRLGLAALNGQLWVLQRVVLHPTYRGAGIAAGFVHGVLNTDNLNVTGESFDYGPWRWLPRYDPMFTAAYFDHSGLYAFGRQPEAAAWNLTRLAETFEGVTRPADLVDDLREGFHRWLEEAVVQGALARLGIVSRGASADAALVDALYVFLLRSKVGYDQAYFDCYGGPADESRRQRSPEAEAYEHESFEAVRGLLAQYTPTDHAARALADEPYFARRRPQSMLIEEVEQLWSAIDERDDWEPLMAKVEAVRAMGRVYGHRSTEPESSLPARGKR